MTETRRADVALAARGLARSRTDAAALIRTGQVLADGVPVVRPSQHIAAETRLHLVDVGPRYVSRAAHKLVGALEAFPEVRVAGRRALDAGASTGGFTQVLLQRGAEPVIAVDVGHGQLAAQIRDDARVIVHEGLNVRALTLEHTAGAVQLVVSDLSFISLRLVAAALAGVCAPGADLLLMVKPQFEVGRAALPRTGVVVDPAARRTAVRGVVEAVLAAGLEARGIARSPLAGQDGNVEFFLHARRSDADAPATDGPEHRATETAAVEAAAERACAAASVDWG